MSRSRLHAYIMLLIVAAIWGIASPVIKFTLGGFDALTFLTYRFGLSTAVAIATFAIVGWHIPKNPITFLKVLVYGFLTSTVSLGFLFFGLENTTVLDSALITLMLPLAVSAAGIRFLNEHVTKREKIGISIAMAGTILTVIEPLLQNGHSQIRLTGNLMIVGYVVATVIGTVLGKRLLRTGVRPLTLTNFSFIVGFITLLPVLFLMRIPSEIWSSVLEISPAYHSGVWYMALLSGSFAYFLSNKAQKSIEIGEQSLFSYLYPLFSVPLAVWWLGETITVLFVIGAAVIAIGVFIAETKKRKLRL
jgi:drug/metabolite transporter (DMT)-like permease